MPRVWLLAALVTAFPFVTAAPTTPNRNVWNRGVLEQRDCTSNNLLRALRDPDSLPEALPFCSSFLHLPTSTFTKSTATPITYVSQEA
jgi:hypothetical protein